VREFILLIGGTVVIFWAWIYLLWKLNDMENGKRPNKIQGFLNKEKGGNNHG